MTSFSSCCQEDACRPNHQPPTSDDMADRDLCEARDPASPPAAIALHLAAAAGDTAEVRALLDSFKRFGATLCQQVCMTKDKHGWTAWHYAASGGNLQLLQEMVAFSRNAMHERSQTSEFEIIIDAKSMAVEGLADEHSTPAAAVPDNLPSHSEAVSTPHDAPEFIKSKHGSNDDLGAPLLPVNELLQTEGGQQQPADRSETVATSGAVHGITPVELLTGTCKLWWENGPCREEKSQQASLLQTGTLVLFGAAAMGFVLLSCLLLTPWVTVDVDYYYLSPQSGYTGVRKVLVQRSPAVWAFVVAIILSLACALSAVSHLCQSLAAAQCVLCPDDRSCRQRTAVSVAAVFDKVKSFSRGSQPRQSHQSRVVELKGMTPPELTSSILRNVIHGNSQLQRSLLFAMVAFSCLNFRDGESYGDGQYEGMGRMFGPSLFAGVVLLAVVFAVRCHLALAHAQKSRRDPNTGNQSKQVVVEQPATNVILKDVVSNDVMPCV